MNTQSIALGRYYKIFSLTYFFARIFGGILVTIIDSKVELAMSILIVMLAGQITAAKFTEHNKRPATKVERSRLVWGCFICLNIISFVFFLIVVFIQKMEGKDTVLFLHEVPDIIPMYVWALIYIVTFFIEFLLLKQAFRSPSPKKSFEEKEEKGFKEIVPHEVQGSPKLVKSFAEIKKTGFLNAIKRKVFEHVIVRHEVQQTPEVRKWLEEQKEKGLLKTGSYDLKEHPELRKLIEEQEEKGPLKTDGYDVHKPSILITMFFWVFSICSFLLAAILLLAQKGDSTLSVSFIFLAFFYFPPLQFLFKKSRGKSIGVVLRTIIIIIVVITGVITSDRYSEISTKRKQLEHLKTIVEKVEDESKLKHLEP